MKTIELKCSDCDFKAKIPVDWGNITHYCTHCGGEMVIDNDNFEEQGQEPVGDNFPLNKEIKITSSNTYKGKNITSEEIESFRLDLILVKGINDL